jgi:hypothetical protein
MVPCHPLLTRLRVYLYYNSRNDSTDSTATSCYEDCECTSTTDTSGNFEDFRAASKIHRVYPSRHAWPWVESAARSSMPKLRLGWTNRFHNLAGGARSRVA